jgi:VWFA-related protein
MKPLPLGVAVASAALVCLGLTGFAQQPPQAPVPTFGSAVDVVQLDVSVLDKDHRPVRGLTAADFTVLEDGRPQKLVTLQAFDIPDPVIPKSGWMREVASDVATNREFNGRLVVVLLDDGAGGWKDVWSNATATRVADTIMEQLGPDDLAAVVYTRLNTKAQNFTADRARLRRAIADIDRKLSDTVDMSIAHWRVRCTAALDQLTRVTAALQAEPQRRKTILFVSPGISLFTVFDRPTLSGDCRQILYRDLLRDTQRGNINIYGIDPGGPPGNIIPQLNRLDGLKALAEHTGGRLILAGKNNDPETRVPPIFDENGSYYLLGFQSDNSKLDGKFRKLEVTVNRPDVDVRTRSGYYAGQPAGRRSKKPATPLSPLDGSITGLLPVTTTPLRVSASPFAIPGKPGATVALALGVEHPAAEVRANAPMLSVVVNAYDLDGNEKASKRTTVDLARAPGATGQMRYEVLARLDLRPGRYEVRIGTETSAQERGSVFAYVDVPDFKQGGLWLSGVFFERTPVLPATPADALAGVVPILPTTVREFASTDRVSTFLRIYQGGGRKLAAAQVAARIVNERDETVFEESAVFGVDRFAGPRSADYRLTLPLDRLPAGEYFLSLDATLDKQHERRDVRFVIR